MAFVRTEPLAQVLLPLSGDVTRSPTLHLLRAIPHGLGEADNFSAKLPERPESARTRPLAYLSPDCRHLADFMQILEPWFSSYRACVFSCHHGRVTVLPQNHEESTPLFTSWGFGRHGKTIIQRDSRGASQLRRGVVLPSWTDRRLDRAPGRKYGSDLPANGAPRMVDFGEKIWKDGEIVASGEAASVSLLTHTLHYGVGAFEGIRAYRRADGVSYVFRLTEHVDRLFDSCKLVMIEPQVTRAQVHEGCLEVLRVNQLAEGYLRPITLMGEGAMGIHAPDNPIETFIVAWKWGAYLGTEGLEKGIRCKISSFSRHHINVGFAKGKLTGQYINSVVAKQEAISSGYDEAIMLDVNGYVSEGSGENIFIVKNGRITTPPLASSILAGITRDTVMTLAREDGLPLREGRITRDELYLADEVFLTGTAAEVTPVREVDGRSIGSGTVGEVTRQLQKRYFDIVRGGDTSHPEWLARV